MSGSFVMSEDEYWSASSGVFYWVVDFLADRVQDQEVADKLKEASIYGFRWVYFNEFSKSQTDGLLHIIRQTLLPEVEKQFPLPEGDAMLNSARKLKDKADSWGEKS